GLQITECDKQLKTHATSWCSWTALLLRVSLRLLRPQKREQNHIANRAGVCQEHDKAINADSLPCRGRHAVGERADVIFVHAVGFSVALFTQRNLSFEALPLLFGIV